ncbi:MAG: universal stress protein [Gammaproteobacteria bacterium]|nr:universal stress protein [Gammaproteobacteria bacterium]
MYTAILHATDLSEHHYKTCQQAAEIAKKFDADLYLLHVIETPSSLVLAQGLGFTEIEDPAPLIEDAETVMSVLRDSLKLSKKQTIVEFGAVKQHILQKATDLQCEMIIIGHHNPNTPVLLGNTARELVDEANCDVLTLR